MSERVRWRRRKRGFSISSYISFIIITAQSASSTYCSREWCSSKEECVFQFQSFNTDTDFYFRFSVRRESRDFHNILIKFIKSSQHKISTSYKMMIFPILSILMLIVVSASKSTKSKSKTTIRTYFSTFLTHSHLFN